MHQNDTPDMTSNTAQENQTNQALAQCQTELDEWKGRALRVAADFDNYQKRIEKEKTSWMQIAQSNVFVDLLSIVDDFERALQQTRKEHANDAHHLRAGLELIQKNLQKMLEKYGVKEIDQIHTFDPELHEGLVQVESPDHQPGSIVTVLQKGYLFKNSVLRPAKVSVAR
jgi:molecular chaperone GrpE